MRTFTMFLLGVSFLMTGCVSHQLPIENVPKTMVTNGKTVEQVEEAIVNGVKARGWSVTDKKPGVIQATLRKRSHVATVDINYDKNGYSITYVSSEGLNASGGSIHKKYNSWIRNLDQDIRTRL